MRLLTLLLLPLLISCTDPAATEEAPGSLTGARTGDVVMVEYTGTLDDGSVFEATAVDQPRGVEIGRGEVLPAFEEALLGMRVGQERDLVVAPENAFGPYRDEPGMRVTISRQAMAHSLELEKGMRLNAAIFASETATESEIVPVTVVAIDADNITVDANHPLAGKELRFHIRVREIVRP